MIAQGSSEMLFKAISEGPTALDSEPDALQVSSLTASPRTFTNLDKVSIFLAVVGSLLRSTSRRFKMYSITK